MKATYLILFLAVFAYGNCFDIDTIKCIISNEKVQEQFMKVLEALKTKDMTTIITTVTTAYLSVKDEINKCLEPKPVLRALEVQPVECAKPESYAKCKERCKGMLNMICRKDCFNLWCLQF